jgi:probable rRNA maturation factor
VSIEIVNLQRCMKASGALLRAAIRRVMTEELRREVNVSVAVVDDERIAELNWVFLGRPEPTDVLAFPLDEGRSAEEPEHVFGEIVISAERARREARKRHADPETELLLYAVHGMLHLAGYDDRTPRERKRMRRRETEVLGSLGHTSG